MTAGAQRPWMWRAMQSNVLAGQYEQPPAKKAVHVGDGPVSPGHYWQLRSQAIHPASSLACQQPCLNVESSTTQAPATHHSDAILLSPAATTALCCLTLAKCRLLPKSLTATVQTCDEEVGQT